MIPKTALNEKQDFQNSRGGRHCNLQTCGHELEYNQFSIDIDTLNKFIA
jgi:hypothetical protein